MQERAQQITDGFVRVRSASHGDWLEAIELEARLLSFFPGKELFECHRLAQSDIHGSSLGDVQGDWNRPNTRNDRPEGGATAIRAVAGMGGVGKSRAAVEYSWTHRDDYTALLWLEAERGMRLDAGLAALRRALAITEASYGKDHPVVARSLHNLAMLLGRTNRLGEAEPLMYRALAIFLAFQRDTGHAHTHRDAVIGNYTRLLAAMGRSEAEIKAALATLRREAGLGQA